MADKPPTHISHAARAAAMRVQQLLLEMLTSNEIGEVAVVVGWGALEPQKRVTTKSKCVKVARGQMVQIETVE